MSFKEQVYEANKGVFLDTGVFADIRTVRYDGKEYSDIPVLLRGISELERSHRETDHIQGLYNVTDVLRCLRDDLGGALPEQGKSLGINTREGGTFFRKYFIVASTDEMGMLRIELEAVEQ